MNPEIPYTASQDDLFNPGKREGYFPDKQQSAAALCAEMSRLAYCRLEPDFGFDKPRVEDTLDRIGFTECDFFESLGTTRGEGVHCFVTTRPNDKLAVVAFRGTDASDLSDVAYDADFIRLEDGGGVKVHAGFEHALDALLNAGLGSRLESLAVNKLLFTGHSLGAAMATLLASKRKPDALYTFGCPRVGNTAFVALLQGVKSYRYQDCCDLVARVPPEFMGYAHVGKPHYINRRRKISFNPNWVSIGYDRIRAEVAYTENFAWRRGNVMLRGLADHAPMNYIWPVRAAEARHQQKHAAGI